MLSAQATRISINIGATMYVTWQTIAGEFVRGSLHFASSKESAVSICTAFNRELAGTSYRWHVAALDELSI